MNLIPTDKARIMELYFRILENEAFLSEYYEYENILLRYGYSPEQVAKNLSKADFKNVTELYYARNPKQTVGKIKDWEPIVIGGLLALGLGLILYQASNKK